MKLSAYTYTAITPNDSTDLTQGYTDGIYIGVSGDLSVQDGTGANVTFTSLAAGVIHPIRTRRIRSTSTTATGIIGLWLRSGSE
jgi:hypothetical protein